MKITALLTFMSFVFCANAQTDAPNQKISFTKNNFSIQYPKTWRLDTSKLMGTELFVFSPLENETDKFSENVNIIIQSLGGQNIDLEAYKQITDKQIKELLTDSQVFESAIIKSDKGDYFKIVYAMTQGKFRLKTTSVCLIHNDKAYLATFSTEFDKYDNYKKVGDEILGSFAVKK